MKRLLFLAAAALAFAACSNDDNALNREQSPILLNSGLSVQQSRATTDLYAASFDEGDQIDVYIAENTAGNVTTTYAQPLVYTAAAATNNINALTTADQPYWPSSGNGVKIYAVYPSGTNGTFKVALDQSTDEAYKASDLMYAATTSERTSKAVNLEFKHLLSKVTIKLVAGNGTPSLDDAKVELLGTHNLLDFNNLTYDACELGSVFSDNGNNEAGNTLVIDKAAKDANYSGSAIVAPQELPANFVKVTLATGGVLYGQLASGAPKLESGYEYCYEIRVSLTALTITATIEKWQSNTDTGEATMQ